MRKGEFLITHRDGQQTIVVATLEYNMSFAPIEMCKWLKDKHDASKVSMMKKIK